MNGRWPALTIRQPWAWAIEHGKHVENRSWEVTFRGPLWLHAGARSRWDPDGAEFRPLRNAWGRWLASEVPGWAGLPSSDVLLGRRTTLMPFGAVAALAEVTGCHHARDCEARTVTISSTAVPTCSPWAVRGQYHWLLANVRPLASPVPCRGALGLWRLPEDIEQQARTQLETARA
ncbi:MAG: hypothetical protein KGJ86_20365 [Chloroflexota bacterium]|nr:hypothetical protein [Chloroflexota bacterium]